MDFKNKIILITGGTGSFGNAMLDRLLNENAKEIRILSRDELKQDLMRQKYHFNEKLKFYIGDVRDYRSIERAFEGVDFVFHAAALKQVPSCEFFPMEAVKTNILGSNNVIDAAIKAKVKKVVFLSTDKACYPINAMGMTKALMERNVIARSFNSGDTILCCTRYGNVMASRGSVIPLFLQQVKDGKPLTITNPEMTRFMMTLEEACELVVYAFEHGNSGDLFILKSSSSTIDELAEAIFKITGKNTGKKIIGTRHSEKLYEALATSEELFKCVDLKNYYKIPKDNRTLNYGNYFIHGKENVHAEESYNSHSVKRLSQKELIDKLMSIELVKDFIKNEK